MVEYTIDDALKLLNKNLSNAQLKLKSTDEDLNYIKDQITTLEVNMNRVYNANVFLKQKSAQQAKQQ